MSKENLKGYPRCKVKNCSRNRNLSVHQLPKCPKMKELWMEVLQLSIDECDNFVVCSDHFVNEDFRKGLRKRILHYSAVPSVNLPPQNPKKKKLSDEAVALESSINSEHLEESIIEEPDEIIIYIDQDCEEESISEEDNSKFAANELVAVEFYDKTTQTDVKYDDKCIQTNLAYDEHLKPFTLLDTLHTDSDLQSWTGIQRFETLNNIVKCLMRLESGQEQLKQLKATPKILTVFVMVKLKTNLTFKQLSCLFSLTPKTLQGYFDKFLPMLKAVLEPVIFWPTKEQVYNNLPKCFKPDFKDCYVVLDCTETPIQRLKSLESNIKTFSHYKGCHTGKINITSVPCGLIANVSRAFGGKASDKFIVLKERLLENVSAGSGVMVDKGYDIQKETSVKGIKLYRPPILDKPQHSKEEACYNTAVATSRIHVERVIQRLKIFNIFYGKFNRSMLKHIDDIVFITAAITNLNSPVLSNEKF